MHHQTDVDISTFRPTRLNQLTAAAFVRQAACHEAGHAVVGVAAGFTLIEADIGCTEERIGDGVIAGGCRFVAPNDDQKQLAKQHPNEFALVAMAGLCAEQMLTGQHLDLGWSEDLNILRVGLGWLDGMDPASVPTLILPFIAAANRQVLQRRDEIEQIASELEREGVVSGEHVHDIVTV